MLQTSAIAINATDMTLNKHTDSMHSFILSNCFIMVRVCVSWDTVCEARRLLGWNACPVQSTFVSFRVANQLTGVCLGFVQ